MKQVRKTLKHDDMMEKMIKSAIALTEENGSMSDFNSGLIYGMKVMMEMFYKAEEGECVGVNLTRIVNRAVNEDFMSRKKR